LDKQLEQNQPKNQNHNADQLNFDDDTSYDSENSQDHSSDLSSVSISFMQLNLQRPSSQTNIVPDQSNRHELLANHATGRMPQNIPTESQNDQQHLIHNQ